MGAARRAQPRASQSLPGGSELCPGGGAPGRNRRLGPGSRHPSLYGHPWHSGASQRPGAAYGGEIIAATSTRRMSASLRAATRRFAPPSWRWRSAATMWCCQSPYYFNHQMWLDMLGVEKRLVPAFAEARAYPLPEEVAALIDDRTRAIVLVLAQQSHGRHLSAASNRRLL